MFDDATSSRFRLVLVAVCLASTVTFAAGQAPPAATPDQKAAVTASPDLTANLAKELNATPEQAAGAAGSLFGVAKKKLSPTDFASVAKAVPGMLALLKAAPAAPAAGGKSGGKSGASALTQMAGAAGGLAAATTAFQSLGLSPALVSKAIPVLTSFVTKSGGADVGKLLAGALK